MAAKKKVDAEKRIETGDWVMLENPLWAFLHRVSGSRSGDYILTYCGLKAIPDVNGKRAHGARCKQCVKKSEAAA